MALFWLFVIWNLSSKKLGLEVILIRFIINFSDYFILTICCVIFLGIGQILIKFWYPRVVKEEQGKIEQEGSKVTDNGQSGQAETVGPAGTVGPAETVGPAGTVGPAETVGQTKQATASTN